ncbi:hypothetical protein Vadar_003522 [Vaccinium darrowii]|uniref:Uncharacterized protein n=1 Tax=Vaccinium darrowii TaxID=229202 RepID=A0ACB7XWT8_9ERIC|nr:hypothetical protein Vadar_003522 [Vaccinium darrowii]
MDPMEGQCSVPILPRLTMPGHRIDPPCGKITGIKFPVAVGRIMGVLGNGSEGVANKAAGLIALLIGDGPGEMKGECHATIMHTKSVLAMLLSLVTRTIPKYVSPLLSMSVNMEVLEAMICEPRGQTKCTVFVELLRQVASLRTKRDGCRDHVYNNRTRCNCRRVHA